MYPCLLWHIVILNEYFIRLMMGTVFKINFIRIIINHFCDRILHHLKRPCSREWAIFSDWWRKIIWNALNVDFFFALSQMWWNFAPRVSFWFILVITKSPTNLAPDSSIMRKFNFGWNVQVRCASLLSVGLTYHLELNLWRLMEICQWGYTNPPLPLGGPCVHQSKITYSDSGNLCSYGRKKSCSA